MDQWARSTMSLSDLDRDRERERVPGRFVEGSAMDGSAVGNGGTRVMEVRGGRSTPTRRPRSHSASRSSTGGSRVVLDERIILNISGVKYQTLRSTLIRISNTLLAELAQNNQFFDDQRHEYFFDRSPTIFEHILNYYRTGELHFADNLCPGQVQRELDFWKIKEQAMEPCCWVRYVAHQEADASRARVRDLMEPVFKAEDKAVVRDEDNRASTLYAHRNREQKPNNVTKFLEKMETSRHCLNAKLLLVALRDSQYEIALFAILFMAGLIVFSLLFYVFETHGAISSLIDSVWWAVVTMTTVGYGDISPKTTLGYIIGAMCAFVGIFAVAVPLPIIANRFNTYYTHLEDNLKLKAKEKAEEITRRSRRSEHKKTR